MGLSLLAPLFLAGAGLLALPYLIHQIRRPEREPMPFGSLLFIPDLPRKVIERKRIQHILLMLLRMLLFLLLVAAFSRPYWPINAATEHVNLPERHLILIDTSYSMGIAGVFEQAKDEALDLLSRIGEDESVGVVSFSRSPRLLAPLSSDGDPGAGTRDRARRAIEEAELSEGGTAYLPALQYAQTMLTATATPPGATRERLILHIVSDFQRNGIPERHTGWKLAPAIELNPVEVRAPGAVNYAITEVGLRSASATPAGAAPNGQLRILGKIKNWSQQDLRDLEVRLIIDGQERATNTLSVKAGNGSQTAFTIEYTAPAGVVDADQVALEGWLEIGSDALALDNRRYFTWNPPRKKPLLLVADERPGERWPALHFFSEALPPDADLPWAAEIVPQKGLEAILTNPAARPAAVIACDLNGWRPETAEALLHYAQTGGQVLLLLNDSMDAATLNRSLLDTLGIHATGPKYTEIRETRFQLLSWVDLDHEIFLPFAGTRFNDFSSIRFYNYITLEIDDTPPGQVRIAARLEDDAPAILEAAVGDGRLIIWAFPLKLDWTNLPKTPRFLPLLHETIAYLCDPEESRGDLRVGQRLGPLALAADEDGTTIVQLPGQDETVELEGSALEESDRLVLRHAGFFRSRPPGDPAWRRVHAVNVAAAEGDLSPLSGAEFELRFASSPTLHDDPGTPPMAVPAFQALPVVKKEYGHRFLVLLFALLVVESWYMSALRR